MSEKTSEHPKLPDIVERLRAEATTIKHQVRGQDPADWKEIGLMREAADEIERLRSPVPAEDMEARKDAAYLERNQVVAALASVFPSGTARTAIPGWSDDWHGCVYIDLPTGQASWHFHDSHAHLFAHLPPYAGKWDGHTTDEKYARLAALPAVPAEDGLREALEKIASKIQDLPRSATANDIHEIAEAALSPDREQELR